ncbi:hypothetical protein [Natrarchaeobius chitinivorans]|uniref:hypothetical protein n=1 Tax=Natrarchaeobius chitinivorans TaxID=1679083 RepID=UPI0014048B9C|nr:hypothetical protein [Natrarchaeobius chitinivorans]
MLSVTGDTEFTLEFRVLVSRFDIGFDELPARFDEFRVSHPTIDEVESAVIGSDENGNNVGVVAAEVLARGGDSADDQKDHEHCERIDAWFRKLSSERLNVDSQNQDASYDGEEPPEESVALK